MRFVRFGSSGKLLEKLDDLITSLIYKLGFFFRQHNTNNIKIETLKSRQWYDKDEIILHFIMKMVVDYVEVESANMCIHEIPKWYQYVPFAIRNPELGLKHLDWEIGLGEESPRQSNRAKIVKEVYLWWKEYQPRQYKQTEDVGLDYFLEKMLQKYSPSGNFITLMQKTDWTDEEKEEYKDLCLASADAKAEAYEKEQEMIKKVINIRDSLWT